MSSRTVSVVLTAQVQNYLTNMKAAEQRTLEVERASRTATQQFAAHNEAVTKLGVGMLAVGATAAAGLAIAIKAATDFGAKMAQLQSLSHASAGTMKELSDAAMSVGTAYGFSALQVADAQIELVKAGVSVQAQLGGALKGALTLAAAGQIDVGQATEIATVAMTQFGLSAGQVPHLADLLSAGADKALGSVGDLGEALKNGGLQAHNMGLTIDDTVGTLSAFANAGILGAEAGTQLRSMFLRLQNPTAASKAAMAEYGITINDASGKFVGISKFADELHDKLDGLTQAQRNSALATMFGSHAIVGASVLYQDGGKAAEKAGNSIGDWIHTVNDSGFAAAQAAGKMNSLQGDTQKLAAAFQTDLIKAGSGANDALRSLAQDATGVLTAFGQIPAPLQDIAVNVGALTAGVGLVGGAFLVAVPKIVAFKAAMGELGVTAKGTLGTFGAISGVLAGYTLLVTMQGKATEAGVANTQQVTAASKAAQDHFQHVNDLFKGNPFVGSGLQAALQDEMDGTAANNKSLDVLGTHIGDVYRSHEAELSALGSQLAGLAKVDYRQSAAGFNSLVKTAGALGDKTKQMFLVKSLGTDYQSSLTAVAKGIGVAASQTNLLAIASGKGALGQQALAWETAQAATSASKQADTLASLAGQASSATTDIGQLQKTIEGFGSAQLDARSATRAMYQAIDDATAAVRKNGKGLDVHTQAGRDNQAALDGIATAADNAASKILKQTGDTGKAAAAMKTGRDAYIAAAVSMGMSADKAKTLADRLGLIPGNIKVAVTATGFDQAQHDADVLSGKINNLNGTTATVYAQLRTIGMTDAQASQVARNAKFADGGAVGGSGPKGVDSVPAVLAPGEHVLTDKDVDKMGGQAGVYAFRNSLHMAAGGAVGEAQRAGGRDRSQAAAYRTSLAQATRNLKAATHHADTADSAYQKAATAAQNIYGKGTAAKKHKAEVHARHLKAAATQAKAAEARKQKQVDSLQKKIAAADQKAQAEASKYTNDSQASEDFVSAQRRDPNPDPLSYVDQLRTMSRDTADYGPKRRASFDKAANQYETAIVTLAAKSAAAAQKLSDLTSASDQMRSSIASAIAGGYQASSVPLTGAHDASTHDVASGWITRNGIRMRNYRTVSVAAAAGHVTAGGVASYYTHGGQDARRFADDLGKLAQRGLNPQLLSEIAGYGVAQGQPIVTALLSGSASQLAQVNSGYKSIAAAGNLAGTTVADDNYAKQIAAAQQNADQITAQLKTDGEKLRHLIASAFGLKGYASGTTAAAGGIRWVGENGPELVGFHGGEAVLNRADSARWVRGVAGSGSAAAPPVEVNVAPFPDTITVQDASGFTATMRVVAHQVVSQRTDQIAVRVMGAA